MTLFDRLLGYQKTFVKSDKRNKFLISSRLIGKSFVTAFEAVYSSFLRDNCLSLVISTGSRASSEWLNKAEMFAEAASILSNGRFTYSKNSDSISFSNGSRILSLPSGNPAALRGYSVQGIVCIDEAFFIEHPNEVLAAINPTLTRSDTAKLIICSTPGSKSNPFFDIMQQAKADKAWHFQQVTIQDAIKDGLSVDLDNLKKLCPDPKMFSLEFECQFLDGVGQLIDTSLLLYFNDMPKIEEYFIGADWARTSDGTAFAVIGRDNQERCWLLDVVNLHNIEYSKQIAIATELFRKYNPKEFLGDAGGLGSPLMEQLNRSVSSKIKPFNFNGNNKPETYEYFRKQVFDRKLFIKEEFKNLIMQDISLVQQTVSESGKTSYVARRFNGSHADIVSAIVLALQAERNNRRTFSSPMAFHRASRFF